jgi:enamine deaminase RidA (YjgF/YER057c/UK114 family)
VIEATVVRCGDLVFVGGVTGGSEDLFPRLAEALAREGATLADVVELTTFHADVREMDSVFEAGAAALPRPYPAWTPVGMVGPASDGAPIVARAIAHTGDREKKAVVPDTISWWRRYPWSAGYRRGDLIAVAGQYGTDTDGNVVTPGYDDGQSRNALNRSAEVCSLLGGHLGDVVDVWSFHQDPRGIEPCLEVAAGEFFTDVLPGWTAAGTPGLYGFGMLCQFRALAEVGERRLVVYAAEAGGDVSAAFEEVAALAGVLVEVVCFHKDVRGAEDVRRAGGRLLGDRSPAWTAVGMTGFAREESLHAIHALAVRT